MDPNDRPTVKECLSMIRSLECISRQKKGSYATDAKRDDVKKDPSHRPRVVWELVVCAHRSCLYLQAPIS